MNRSIIRCWTGPIAISMGIEMRTPSTPPIAPAISPTSAPSAAVTGYGWFCWTR
jgi:hypothetical protein